VLLLFTTFIPFTLSAAGGPTFEAAFRNMDHSDAHFLSDMAAGFLVSVMFVSTTMFYLVVLCVYVTGMYLINPFDGEKAKKGFKDWVKRRCD
jgi:hypothetical protein